MLKKPVSNRVPTVCLFSMFQRARFPAAVLPALIFFFSSVAWAAPRPKPVEGKAKKVEKSVPPDTAKKDAKKVEKVKEKDPADADPDLAFPEDIEDAHEEKTIQEPLEKDLQDRPNDEPPRGIAVTQPIPTVLPAHKPVVPYVKSKWGSVQLWGLLQARFVMPLRGTFSGGYQTFKGNTMENDQNMAFEVQRIRLLLTGHILSENFTYMFQGDAAGGPPWLLDVRFGYSLPCIPGLTIYFGRFLPNFSLMMPTLITRLETAEYPIILTEGAWAPWRQLGLQAEYKIGLGPGTFGGYIGVFNGPADGWTDDNHHKDFLIRADYAFEHGPAKGLMVGINTWIGFPKCSYNEEEPGTSTCNERDFILNRADMDVKAGVMARYVRGLTAFSGVTAMAEFMFRHYTPWAENVDTFMGYGGWAHLAYMHNFGPTEIEGLVRMDFLAPNTSVSKNHAWRLTAGLNWYFQKIHSHVKINYIYQNNSENYTGRASWIDVKYPDDPLFMDDWQVKRDLHMFLVQANTEF